MYRALQQSSVVILETAAGGRCRSRMSVARSFSFGAILRDVRVVFFFEICCFGLLCKISQLFYQLVVESESPGSNYWLFDKLTQLASFEPFGSEVDRGIEGDRHSVNLGNKAKPHMDK